MKAVIKITFRRTTRFWSDMRKILIFGKTWEWLLKLLMYWFLMLVYKSLGITMTKGTIFVRRLQCFWFIFYRDVSFVDQIKTRRFGLFNLSTVRYHHVALQGWRRGGGGVGGCEALVQSGSSLLLEISFILFKHFLLWIYANPSFSVSVLICRIFMTFCWVTSVQQVRCFCLRNKSYFL